MSGRQKENVQTGTSAFTLLIVAIAGGVIAVSLQPLILALYSNIGLQIAPLLSQQTTTVTTLTTTAAAPVVTSKVPKTTTTTTTFATTTMTTTTVKASVVKNDPTVDEELIFLKEEPLTVKFPEATSEKSKESTTKTPPKSEETTSKSQRVKLEKVPQQPEIIDVTGRNKEIPDVVKNFKSTTISMFLNIYTSSSV